MKVTIRSSIFRNVFLIVTILFATNLSASARSLNYFADIKSKYETFVVVKVMSADAIQLPSGQECFFKYNADVVETIRGNIGDKRLAFFSESGLTIGSDYLVYLSDVDAKKYRVVNEFNEHDNAFCKQQMTGLLFLRDEIQEIEDRRIDGRSVRYVRFDDPWADFIEGHSKNETTRLIDFDYVKQCLVK